MVSIFKQFDSYRKYLEFHFMQAGQSFVAPRMTSGKFLPTQSLLNSNDVGKSNSSGTVEPKYKSENIEIEKSHAHTNIRVYEGKGNLLCLYQMHHCIVHGNVAINKLKRQLNLNERKHFFVIKPNDRNSFK